MATDRAAAPVSERPDLHAAIMNLPFTLPASGVVSQGYLKGHEDARHAAAELVLADRAASAPQALRVPLTNEQIEETLGAAYRKLVIDAGYNGGMGGETWDRAAARAIEAAHGIVPLAPQDTGERG